MDLVEKAECLVCGYCRCDLNLSFAELLICEYFFKYGLILHDIDLLEVSNNDIKDYMTLQDLFTSFIAINNNYFISHPINTKSSYYVSSLIAKLFNDILMKSSKMIINSADIDYIFDILIKLINNDKHIERDIFERDYQQYFAKRLLNNLYQSLEMEKLIINKPLFSEIKYVNNLNDMIQDIERSYAQMIGFNDKYKFDFEMNIRCCRTGVWPTPSIQPIKTTDNALEIAMQRFKSFWSNRYNVYDSHRCINFEMDKGTAEIRVAFSDKTWKILVVSTYQMITLLLFNQKNILTFNEMLYRTGIPREDLIDAILSMAHPKVKILKKSPNNNKIEDNHKFQLNVMYKHLKKKIDVPTFHNITNKMNEKDVDREMESVFRLRRSRMDAAIVRIMKIHQTMKHLDLINETIKELNIKFTAKPVDIEKRIETLIELEYLRRDDHDQNVYHYYR